MIFRLLLILALQIPTTWVMNPCACECFALCQMRVKQVGAVQETSHQSCCQGHSDLMGDAVCCQQQKGTSCCGTKANHASSDEAGCCEIDVILQTPENPCACCVSVEPAAPFESRQVQPVIMMADLLNYPTLFVGVTETSTPQLLAFKQFATHSPVSHTLRAYDLPIHELCRVWLN